MHEAGAGRALRGARPRVRRAAGRHRAARPALGRAWSTAGPGRTTSPATPTRRSPGSPRRAAAAGMRLLLIRRHGRRPDDRAGPGLLADTASGAPRATTCTVAGPTELADLPLPAPGRAAARHPAGRPAAAGLHARPARPLLRPRRAGAGRRPGRGRRTGRLGVQPPRRAPVRADRAGAAHRLPLREPGPRLGRRRPQGRRRRRGRDGPLPGPHARGRPAGQVAELAVRAATGLRDADALVVHADVGDTVPVHTAPASAGWSTSSASRSAPAARPPAAPGWPRSCRSGRPAVRRAPDGVQRPVAAHGGDPVT